MESPWPSRPVFSPPVHTAVENYTAVFPQTSPQLWTNYRYVIHSPDSNCGPAVAPSGGIVPPTPADPACWDETDDDGAYLNPECQVERCWSVGMP